MNPTEIWDWLTSLFEQGKDPVEELEAAGITEADLRDAAAELDERIALDGGEFGAYCGRFVEHAGVADAYARTAVSVSVTQTTAPAGYTPPEAVETPDYYKGDEVTEDAYGDAKVTEAGYDDHAAGGTSVMDYDDDYDPYEGLHDYVGAETVAEAKAKYGDDYENQLREQFGDDYLGHLRETDPEAYAKYKDYAQQERDQADEAYDDDMDARERRMDERDEMEREVEEAYDDKAEHLEEELAKEEREPQDNRMKTEHEEYEVDDHKMEVQKTEMDDGRETWEVKVDEPEYEEPVHEPVAHKAMDDDGYEEQMDDGHAAPADDGHDAAM